MDTAIDTALMAAFALAAVAALMAMVLWSVAPPRREPHRSLDRLPLQAVLYRLGGDPRHYLRRTSEAEVQDRLRACSDCAEALRCKRLLASRCEASAFAFCPNFASLRTAAAAYERSRNPYAGAQSALPPHAWRVGRSPTTAGR